MILISSSHDPNMISLQFNINIWLMLLKLFESTIEVEMVEDDDDFNSDSLSDVDDTSPTIPALDFHD